MNTSNLSSCFRNPYKMSHQERFQYYMETMLGMEGVSKELQPSIPIGRIVWNAITGIDDEPEHEFLVIPSEWEDLKDEAKTRRLKEKFVVGAVPVSLQMFEKDGKPNVHVTPLFADMYLGWDLQALTEVSKNVLMPRLRNQQFPTYVGLPHQFALEPFHNDDGDPPYQVYYFMRVLNGSLHMNRRKETVEVENKRFSKLWKPKVKIPHDIIEFRLEVKNGQIPLPLITLSNKAFGTRIYPDISAGIHRHKECPEFCEIMKNIYIEALLNQPPITAYVICGGFLFHLFDQTNMGIEGYLDLIEPLGVLDVRPQNLQPRGSQRKI